MELAEHLIPLADIEISKRIERIFKQNKIKFYLKDSKKDFANGGDVIDGMPIANSEFISCLNATFISNLPSAIRLANKFNFFT